MHFLDLTFPTPAMNLACDEALLSEREAGQGGELLRVWEPASYFVVLGRSNPVRRDVDEKACHMRNIPFFRRTSGGGTVLLGPGCLNYSLILSIGPESPYQNLSTTYSAILQRHRQAVGELMGLEIQIQGISDLTMGNQKFSGNAQRRKKRFLLFHGTFLLHFDLSLIGQLLPLPGEAPEYRAGRPHEDFLANLGVSASALKECLRKTWMAQEPLEEIPLEKTRDLAGGFLSDPEWIYQF